MCPTIWKFGVEVCKIALSERPKIRTNTGLVGNGPWWWYVCCAFILLIIRLFTCICGQNEKHQELTATTTSGKSAEKIGTCGRAFSECLETSEAKKSVEHLPK